MTGTETYTLVEGARKALIVRGQTTFWLFLLWFGWFLLRCGLTALANLEATLAQILTELNDTNPQAAERFIKRLDNLTKEL